MSREEPQPGPAPPVSAAYPRVGVAVANMTGTLVRRHVARLEKTVGHAVVQDALDHIGERSAEDIRNVSPLGWVPVDTVERFYETVAEAAGRDVTALHWEIGQACTRDAFRTVWRVLLRLTSDEALVARTPMLYARTYDRGRLETHITGPGRAELTLSDWPNPPTFVRRGLCIGITTVLQLAGRRDIGIRDEAAGRNTIFSLTWTP